MKRLDVHHRLDADRPAFHVQRDEVGQRLIAAGQQEEIGFPRDRFVDDQAPGGGAAGLLHDG
jgi:hypothetical protein